jgi:hypothetical protein
VLISLNQFNEVTYESSTSTARIGGGNIWDDVYTTLTAQGINVVGSRISGVGMHSFYSKNVWQGMWIYSSWMLVQALADSYLEEVMGGLPSNMV